MTAAALYSVYFRPWLQILGRSAGRFVDFCRICGNECRRGDVPVYTRQTPQPVDGGWHFAAHSRGLSQIPKRKRFFLCFLFLQFSFLFLSSLHFFSGAPQITEASILFLLLFYLFFCSSLAGSKEWMITILFLFIFVCVITRVGSGMRRPSWNKSQAIQQVISLKALLEPCDDSGAGALRKVVVSPRVSFSLVILLLRTFLT